MQTPVSRIEGPVFTLPTPFDRLGRVDFGALQDLLGFLQAAGAQCVVTNGTTSEFSMLTLEERRKVLESVRSGFKGIVINHIGSSCAQDCSFLLEHSCTCADAVLAMPPFFFSSVSNDGVKEFWRQFFPASSLPIFLYNFPTHTQFSCQPAFVANVAAEFPMVCGIKDSGTDFKLSVEFRQARQGFSVFVGSERSTVDALSHGLNGAVCGLGNALPELQLAIHQKARSGLTDKAYELQRMYNEWLDFRKTLQVNPAELVKVGIAARIPGFPTMVRPPLVPLDKAFYEATARLVKRLLPNASQ